MIPEHVLFLLILDEYRHTSSRSTTLPEVSAFNKEKASILLALLSAVKILRTLLQLPNHWRQDSCCLGSTSRDLPSPPPSFCKLVSFPSSISYFSKETVMFSKKPALLDRFQILILVKKQRETSSLSVQLPRLQKGSKSWQHKAVTKTD